MEPSSPIPDEPDRAVDRPLDRIDRQILVLLQRDGRMPIAELAREVHLTLTPCLERVRRLERQGYIEGYFARVSARRLGQRLLAFTEVTLDRTTADVFERFKASMQLVDEVLECHMVAGGFDYLLKMRVADMDEYRRVLGDRISSVRGVQQTQTYFVMEEVKSTHVIHIRGAERPARASATAGRRKVTRQAPR